MHIILGVFSTMILTPSLCLELSETWAAPQHYCHMFSPSATVYCHASKSLLPRCLSCCHCLLPRFQVLAATLFAFVITAPLRFQPYTEYYTAKLLRCYAEFFLVLIACHSSILLPILPRWVLSFWLPAIPPSCFQPHTRTLSSFST